MLFVGAKIAQLSLLPQGKPERETRVQNMILAMDQEQFGSCTNTLECEAVCPKEISTSVIGILNQNSPHHDQIGAPMNTFSDLKPQQRAAHCACKTKNS